MPSRPAMVAIVSLVLGALGVVVVLSLPSPPAGPVSSTADPSAPGAAVTPEAATLSATLDRATSEEKASGQARSPTVKGRANGTTSGSGKRDHLMVESALEKDDAAEGT